MGRREIRSELRNLKKQKNLKDFRNQLNDMHTRAYALAAKHYQEALSCCLPEKKAREVIAKAQEIRESWDNIRSISVETTEGKENELNAYV